MWTNDREVFKQIMIRVQELSPESRLRLIEEVARSIKPTVRTSVNELEQAEIEAQMREGYLATRQERQELNEEWQIVDGEGWPT